MKTKPVRVSQDERKLKRQKVAEAVKGGATVEQAARMFSYTVQHVRMACREFGVTWPGQRTAANSTGEATS